ncbi:hypothetical protein [Derxia lacustris]|uniref:hypothetical protein n=1 Tax=Derxia lacustris TaxID=764842 RepID=UPI00111C9007|nr:hypothetical protein [Derxia lacustris]
MQSRLLRLFAFARSAWPASVLALLLLFGQTLGQVHRIAHAAWPVPAVERSALPAVGAAAVADERTSLFGHAADRIACALFDGVALAAALPGVALALALLCAALVRRLSAAIALPDLRRIAAFLSRAPPRPVPFG